MKLYKNQMYMIVFKDGMNKSNLDKVVVVAKLKVMNEKIVSTIYIIL